MVNAAKLSITNCLDCPHKRQFQDPSSGDSWDFHDTSLGCGLTEGYRTPDRWNIKGVRLVDACDRSNKRENCTVPDWCPLLPKKRKPRVTK